MTDCGERGYIRGFRSVARIIIAGALLCLLTLVWIGGRTPAARASGVPWCTTTVERAPTRPAIHLNRRPSCPSCQRLWPEIVFHP